jgi:hypothetical protein
MDIRINRPPQLHSTWFTKFIECFFTGVACLNVFLLTINLLPQAILVRLGQPFFGILFLGQFVLGLGFGIGYSIYWQRREGPIDSGHHTHPGHHTDSAYRIDSGLRHAWLRGILRYWLATEIATYGFAKLLKTQFAVSYYRNDTPVHLLSGFELTWNYFAHSYTLAVIIGLLQIGGSVLLLFRRTTLFGVVILLPIMFNIVLINLFYHIAVGAFLNSILFTGGLLYLLLLRRRELMRVFWAVDGGRGHPADAPTGLPVVPASAPTALPADAPTALRADDPTALPAVRLGPLKNVFRFLAIGSAFGILFYAVTAHPVCPLAGKWTINRIIRNGDTLKTNAWLTDSTAWTTAYIEERGALGLCPNPYVFDGKRSTMTQYTYDSALHQFKLTLLKNRADTFLIRVRQQDSRSMQWNAVINDDTVSMKLSRAD